ncbi:MAG: hypothetical protein WBA57_14285 [Elainellaceae cyanobacterium]
MGEQLSFLPEVPPYSIIDPWSLAAGDTITTPQGTATVTHSTIAGEVRIIHADYGSGVSQPHLPEDIRSVVRKRRYSKPGQASGWIEERIGNRKRKTPSISYYYCWQDELGRHRRYIPAGKVWRIQRMVEVEERPVTEIVEVLCPVGENR